MGPYGDQHGNPTRQTREYGNPVRHTGGPNSGQQGAGYGTTGAYGTHGGTDPGTVDAGLTGQQHEQGRLSRSGSSTDIAEPKQFAYKTPRKTADLGEFKGIETPNAPKQSRASRPRFSENMQPDVSIKLFASGSKDNRP